MADRPDDPVLARRARADALATAGKRTGYGLFGVAIILFGVGLLTRYSPGLTTAIVVALLAGSAVLAPAIVLGYAVRAAARDEQRGEGPDEQREEPPRPDPAH